jgi:hypothetical protein
VDPTQRFRTSIHEKRRAAMNDSRLIAFCGLYATQIDPVEALRAE